MPAQQSRKDHHKTTPGTPARASIVMLALCGNRSGVLPSLLPPKPSASAIFRPKPLPVQKSGPSTAPLIMMCYQSSRHFLVPSVWWPDCPAMLEGVANLADINGRIYLSSAGHVRELSDNAVGANLSAVDILNTRIARHSTNSRRCLLRRSARATDPRPRSWESTSPSPTKPAPRRAWRGTPACLHLGPPSLSLPRAATSQR